MAAREMRASWKRLMFFFMCIAVCVVALVALSSVSQSARYTFAGEARSLIAADAIITSNQPLKPAALEKIAFFFFKQKTAYEIGLGIPAEPLFRSKRRGCLTVPRLTLMSLIKMMLVMVSVAAISKTFGLLRFLLRLSFLAK